MKKRLMSLLVLVLAACAADEGLPTNFDGGPGFDAGRPGSNTALDRQCTEASNVRVASCGPEFASGYCGLGSFIETTSCESQVASFFQCQIDAPGPALCSEDSPCAPRQQDAFLCLRAHCDLDPYQAGCIDLYGCPADCAGKVCGDDDRCGGVCTFCADGRCNESAGMCETGGGAGNHDAACDCGSFTVDAPESAILCRDACTGDTTCLEQLLADEGRCAFICDVRDHGEQGSCPRGWTCFESFFEEVGAGTPIAECIED